MDYKSKYEKYKLKYLQLKKTKDFDMVKENIEIRPWFFQYVDSESITHHDALDVFLNLILITLEYRHAMLLLPVDYNNDLSIINYILRNIDKIGHFEIVRIDQGMIIFNKFGINADNIKQKIEEYKFYIKHHDGLSADYILADLLGYCHTNLNISGKRRHIHGLNINGRSIISFICFDDETDPNIINNNLLKIKNICDEILRAYGINYDTHIVDRYV